MRILQFSYSLASGGAERFVVDLCNEVSKDHEVYLCIVRDLSISEYNFYLNEVNDEIKIVNLKIPEGFSLKYIFEFYKVIKQIKPNVVHCHLNLVNYLFPLTLIFRKIKFFHTIHSNAKDKVANKIEYFVRRFYYRYRLINAVTISHETSRSFTSYYNTNNFSQIYNGRVSLIPTKHFETVKKEFQEIRNGQNVKVFLHVASCSPEKNQQMLISVFNRLVREKFIVQLIIIGANFNSVLGAKLKKLAMDDIHFLGEKHNVSDYYLNSDAFCLSSIREGMPITLIEAFSCGCIPICTPVGGMKDVIKDKINGYLASDNSEEEYFNSIIRFLNNPNKIEKNDLINFYQKNFTIEKCAQKYIELFLR